MKRFLRLTVFILSLGWLLGVFVAGGFLVVAFTSEGQSSVEAPDSIVIVAFTFVLVLAALFGAAVARASMPGRRERYRSFRPYL